MITAFIAKCRLAFWALPGLLLWASFPPMAERSDCLFALIPLMWTARRADARRSFKIWFANGFIYWFATLSWMPAIVKNGGPWPLVVLGWGVLSLYCALYFGAYGWLSAKAWAWAKDEGAPWRSPPRFPYCRRLGVILLFEPLMWAALELVRSRLFGGFSWNQLGVPLIAGSFGTPALLGGVYLVSAVVVLINGMFTGIIERVFEPRLKLSGENVPRAPKYIRSLETILPLLLIGSIYFLSFFLNVHLVKGVRTVRAAMVQRNFPCVFNSAAVEDPMQVYSNLLANVAYVKPDLVVLPESALCEFGRVDSIRAASFAAWVRKETGASAVIAGGSRREEEREYNSAALYSDSGVQIYDKVHLVPFGEFIPGDKLFPFLQRFAPVGSCSAGKLKCLTLPSGLKVGVAICFEDTDSAQIRELAAQGADLLVLITNDSWFSNSDEAVQHSWQALVRAAETGLPVVRCGNSGVTGTISRTGRVNWLVGSDGKPLVDAKGTMCEAVEIGRDFGWKSWYVRLGDIPLMVAFILLILSMIMVKYRNEYEKRRYLSM